MNENVMEKCVSEINVSNVTPRRNSIFRYFNLDKSFIKSSLSNESKKTDTENIPLNEYNIEISKAKDIFTNRQIRRNSIFQAFLKDKIFNKSASVELTKTVIENNTKTCDEIFEIKPIKRKARYDSNFEIIQNDKKITKQCPLKMSFETESTENSVKSTNLNETSMNLVIETSRRNSVFELFKMNSNIMEKTSSNSYTAISETENSLASTDIGEKLLKVVEKKKSKIRRKSIFQIFKNYNEGSIKISVDTESITNSLKSINLQENSMHAKETLKTKSRRDSIFKIFKNDTYKKKENSSKSDLETMSTENSQRSKDSGERSINFGDTAKRKSRRNSIFQLFKNESTDTKDNFLNPSFETTSTDINLESEEELIKKIDLNLKNNNHKFKQPSGRETNYKKYQTLDHLTDKENNTDIISHRKCNEGRKLINIYPSNSNGDSLYDNQMKTIKTTKSILEKAKTITRRLSYKPRVTHSSFDTIEKLICLDKANEEKCIIKEMTQINLLATILFAKDKCPFIEFEKSTQGLILGNRNINQSNLLNSMLKEENHRNLCETLDLKNKSMKEATVEYFNTICIDGSFMRNHMIYDFIAAYSKTNNLNKSTDLKARFYDAVQEIFQEKLHDNNTDLLIEIDVCNKIKMENIALKIYRSHIQFYRGNKIITSHQLILIECTERVTKIRSVIDIFDKANDLLYTIFCHNDPLTLLLFAYLKQRIKILKEASELCYDYDNML